MTKDLEETLAELGPEYRAVVDRVSAAYRTGHFSNRRIVESSNRRSGLEVWKFGGLVSSQLTTKRGGNQKSETRNPKQETNNQQPATKRGALAGWSAAYLVAASLLIFLGLGIFFSEPTVRGTSDSRMVYTVAYAPNETALASILASQRPDGSWDNDFITRQNAAALRNAQDAEMHIAYKKAVRYLKSRGLRPLSDAELKARGDEAARVLANI